MLFRAVIARPRPIRELRYRTPLKPELPLFVRALTASEDLAALYDPSVLEEHKFLVQGRWWRRIIATALCAGDGAPLLSYDDTGAMTDGELAPLALAVVEALNVVSPMRWRSNIVRWRQRLELGASHFTNVATTLAMVECSDYFSGGGRQWQPGRFYGLPVADLTDGQIMAYDAAVDAYKRLGRGNG